MKSHKRLMEQYEDAMFAVLMNEVMAEEGEELLRENERLKADPGFVIPEDADRRCRKTITRAFRKQKRISASRTAWRVFQRVSVAAFTAVILFTGVYAVSEKVRTAALNLLIDVSDVATGLSFRPEDNSSESREQAIERIYEFSELPDGFELTEAGDDGFTYWRNYTNHDASIMLSVMEASASMSNLFDTEDADNLEDIEVNGNTGFLVEKNGAIRVELADEEHQVFIDIRCSGLSREEVLNLVLNLTYTG